MLTVFPDIDTDYDDKRELRANTLEKSILNI